MNERKIKIVSSLLAILMFSTFVLLFFFVNYKDVYIVGLFSLYVAFRQKWATPKIMFYEIFTKKLREKTIKNLQTIFNEENSNFLMANFKTLGAKGDYLLGTYKLKLPDSSFEYLVIIDTNYYWNSNSFFPKKYNINSHNLVSLSQSKIEFREDNIHEIIHRGHKWYFAFNEVDINDILERVGINDGK